MVYQIVVGGPKTRFIEIKKKKKKKTGRKMLNKTLAQVTIKLHACRLSE
jgi:hypothetical protein